jgi:flagellar protein FliO/FliZ
MLELGIRLVFSLAAVLGLLALLTKVGARRFRGRNDAMVQVLHRQHLSRGTAVSVITVGSRVLVLGTTEHQVSVLAELDPEEVADHLGDQLPDPVTGDVLTLVPSEDTASFELVPVVRPAGRTAGAHRGGRRVAARAPEGAFSGSVLSVDTWRQALAAATRKAS